MAETRSHDAATLARVEPLLAFAARGHTAGEARQITGLLTLDDAALAQQAFGPRTAGAEGAATIRVVGAIATATR